MKKKITIARLRGVLWKMSAGLLSFLIFGACSGTENIFNLDKANSDSKDRGFVVANFESESMTPYFFRFGNHIGNSSVGQKIDLQYEPRWVYSHEVVANPLMNAANSSSYVLKYTTMDVNDVGLKIRFSQAYVPSDIENIQIKLYQPANVLGKSTWNGKPVAEKQQVCLKLLSEFDAVCDFRKDDGVELHKAVQSFTQEGEWVTMKFDFNKKLYGSAAFAKLKQGVVGMAIMPTYGANTILVKDNPYCCYIDDILFNVN